MRLSYCKNAFMWRRETKRDQLDANMKNSSCRSKRRQLLVVFKRVLYFIMECVNQSQALCQYQLKVADLLKLLPEKQGLINSR